MADERPAFALVKFLDDDKLLIVETENIKKFKPNWDKTKAYKVLYEDGHRYSAQIIATADTKEELQSRQNKRLHVLPKRLIYDESASSSLSELSDIENVKPSIMKPKDLNKAIQASNFNRILSIPVREKETASLPPAVQQTELQMSKSCENCKKLMKENKALLHRNFELQDLLINKFKNFDPAHIIDKESENKTDEVGARRNGEVHLGRGVYLPSQIFDSIYQLGRKKDALFIKELASAVFGDQILASSSVSGKGSNRYHKEARPPLDPTKKLAIIDILTFRLKERGESQENIQKILSTVNQRLGEKIQDILRPSRKQKKAVSPELNLEDEIEEANAVLANE